MLKILDINQKNEWKKIVNSAFQYDFYHTYDYHYIAQKNGEGVPKLFLYTFNDEFVALPLLERIIDKSRNLKDYTSVYGYVGPIFSNDIISNECLNGFRAAFEAFVLNNNIVSVFSRLHPLINQNMALNDLGRVDLLSNTVTIELNYSIEEQRRKYRKSNKSEINKLRRTVKCEKAITQEEIDLYISIYIDNMKRVNAASRYFFNRNYFLDLLNADDFNTEIFLAYEDGEVLAGAMMVNTQKIVQYHLAGTAEKHLSKAPMKLILDEVRINATEQGFDYLHLGGGVGSEEDSLFKFKSGFSDRYDQFEVWKYIVKQDLYDELVESRKNNIINNNNFPLYRG